MPIKNSIYAPKSDDNAVNSGGTFYRYSTKHSGTITVYEGNPSMKYDGTVYAGSGDDVPLTFTHNYVGCTVKDYGVAKGDATLTKNDAGDYTLKTRSTIRGPRECRGVVFARRTAYQRQAHGLWHLY